MPESTSMVHTTDNTLGSAGPAPAWRERPRGVKGERDKVKTAGDPKGQSRSRECHPIYVDQ